MGVKSDDILKLSLAAAALAGGLGAAYHYAIYIPARDERLDAEKQAQVQKLAASQAAEKSASSARSRAQQAGYRVCLSNAQLAYSARWDASCKSDAEVATRLRQSCIDGGSDVNWCVTQYPVRPVADCTLSGSLATSYDEGLKASKQRCLDEAKIGMAGVDPE